MQTHEQLRATRIQRSAHARVLGKSVTYRNRLYLSAVVEQLDEAIDELERQREDEDAQLLASLRKLVARG